MLLIKVKNENHFEVNDVNLHPHGGLAELVDCTGLETRRTARYRGFESLSLRNEKRSHQRAFSFGPSPYTTSTTKATSWSLNLLKRKS